MESEILFSVCRCCRTEVRKGKCVLAMDSCARGLILGQLPLGERSSLVYDLAKLNLLAGIVCLVTFHLPSCSEYLNLRAKM
jgi:hypothetical protein